MIANVHKARGTYAPYRIRNETGSSILVWSETDGTANSRDIDSTKIVNEQVIDWRFDDWKTMREVCFSSFIPMNTSKVNGRTSPLINTTLAYNLLRNLGNHCVLFRSIERVNLFTLCAPDQINFQVGCSVKLRLSTIQKSSQFALRTKSKT